MFLDGFSTKFDEKTGNIQRGLGLASGKTLCGRDFQRYDRQQRAKRENIPEFIVRIPESTVCTMAERRRKMRVLYR